MKKIIAMAVLTIMVMAGSAWAISEIEIDARKDYLITLNPDLKNPSLIYPGDKIIISENPVTYYTVSTPESLWAISEKHLIEESKITVTAIVDEPLVIKEVVVLEAKTAWSMNVWWALLFAAILVASLIAILLKRRKNPDNPGGVKRNRKVNSDVNMTKMHEAKSTADMSDNEYKLSPRNVDNYHRVVANGFAGKSSAEVAKVISENYTAKSTVLKVERMILVRVEENSVKRVPVVMAHRGNRTLRNSAGAVIQKGILYLNHNDPIWVVTRKKGDIEYYLEHCGNHFHEISSGKFDIPKGWSVVAEPTSLKGESYEPKPKPKSEGVSRTDTLALSESTKGTTDRAEPTDGSEKEKGAEVGSSYEKYVDDINRQNSLETYRFQNVS